MQMNRQTPFFLFFLLAYIFFPALFSWIIDAERMWYKPYLIWLVIIIVAYAVSVRKERHEP